MGRNQVYKAGSDLGTEEMRDLELGKMVSVTSMKDSS